VRRVCGSLRNVGGTDVIPAKSLLSTHRVAQLRTAGLYPAEDVVDMDAPAIAVETDYDGYFERLVKSWVARKSGKFNHSLIHITAGPYRSAAVSFEKDGDTLHLDFYSALRTGFGALSEAEILQIIELL